MFGIFKRKMNGHHAEQEQKEQSLDRIVLSATRQAEELVMDIRRVRERRLADLKQVFGVAEE